MNRKVLVAAVTLGLGAAVAPKPASATCSNTNLQVCASVSAFYNGSGHLIIRAYNMFGVAGVSHVMNFVGIGSASFTGTATLNSARFNGALISTWVKANNWNQNTIGAQLDLAALASGGVNGGLVGCGGTIPPGLYVTGCSGAGPYLELDFTTSQVLDLSTATTAWHSMLINGTSCSLFVDQNGNYAQSTSAGDTGDCSSVVPEPISMVLLGTGLAGMGGAGLIRRRKKEQV